MLNIGDPVPDFELQNQDGETVKTSDLRGKKVLLFAYPKANTPGCTRQACGFRDAYETFDTAGAVVLGLSPDKPAALKKWQDKENLPFDLLSDPEHEVLDQLGAWGEKSMYGKKYFGVVRSHYVFDEDGKAIDVQIKISPAKSIEKGVKFFES